MRKSELIEWLKQFEGDPEVVIESRSADGVGRLVQTVDAAWAASDAALGDDDRLFWEDGDAKRPARYPGDSPDDPELVLAVVLR